MKRLFDLVLVVVLFSLLAIPMLLVAIAVLLISRGRVLYWSDRIGIDNVIFKMPKFRSMRMETPDVATHKMTNPNEFLTPIGGFLRRNSLDELPQLFSIFKGDMSFVGPRPALFNQEDLIVLTTKNNVHILLPGLSGWAQVNGRDDLQMLDKVLLDVEYLKRRTFWFDLRILWMTLLKVVKKEGITH